MKAYRLKLELVGSEPLIWRRFMIPAGATFYRLYDTIQFTMGWFGNSLYEPYFYEYDLPDENIRITNDDDALDEKQFQKLCDIGFRHGKILDPFGVIEHQKQQGDNQKQFQGDAGNSVHKKPMKIVRNPRSIKIDKYIEKYGCLNYVYDLQGDRWQHILRLESIFDDYPFGYPALLGGAEECPSESVHTSMDNVSFNKEYPDLQHPNHPMSLELEARKRSKPLNIEWTNYLLKFIKIKKTEWMSMGLGGGHFELTGRELDRFR